MKQNIPTPVVIGVLVLALIGILSFFAFRSANRENQGVDLDLARKRQMQQHQRLTQPGTSAQEKAQAYGGK